MRMLNYVFSINLTFSVSPLLFSTSCKVSAVFKSFVSGKKQMSKLEMNAKTPIVMKGSVLWTVFNPFATQGALAAPIIQYYSYVSI